MIRVFVAEDQKTVQQILKSYLELEPDLEVVGTAVNGQLAIDRIETLKPDVVIMDIEMPEVDGLTATRAISQRFGETKVLILSIHDDDCYLNNALQVGAKGYLLKTTPPKELINAIRAVHQGYFQLGPGLIEKIHSELTERVKTYTHASFLTSPKRTFNELKYLQHQNSHLIKSENKSLRTFGVEFLPLFQDLKGKNKSLTSVLLLNAAIWILVLSYLNFFPHSYTSKWGIKIIEKNPDNELNISESEEKKSPKSINSKADYVYIANSHLLLEKAAQKLNLSIKEFGRPEILADRNSDLISFEIQGKNPVEAQQKAWIIHQLMVQQIDRLRQAQLHRQEKEIKVNLESARSKLNSVQEQLAKFRENHNNSIEEEIDKLSVNIEELRRQRSQITQQEMSLENRYIQLENNLKFAPDDIANAYKIQADNFYQIYLKEYSQSKQELADLLTQFTTKHPLVVAQQVEVREALILLQKQTAFVLQKTVSLEMLNNLMLLSTKLPEVDKYRDLATNPVERQKLSRQNSQLEREINDLEQHRENLLMQKAKIDRLKRDLKVAESVFTATLTKLNSIEDNIYDNYPPTQLVAEPNLPNLKEQTIPDTNSAIWTGLAGSCLVTTSLFLLTANRSRS
jgi:DNA-binding NarL/FixJ family response regulator/uncharacterized protein involved in exopolysaccharide biosynthesis